MNIRLNNRSVRVWALLIPGTMLWLAGCQDPHAAPSAQQLARGDRVYLFPGIGGIEWTLSGAMQAFRDAGVTAELRFVEWPTPFFAAMDHLQDYAANRAHADELAREIVAHRQQHPDATIDVVGYSGGGGVAVLVIEALPPAAHPRNLVLVQSAVSPTHDLTRALERLDGHLVNFYCPSDWFILGVGTQTFGTVDRVQTASAGKDGFDAPRAVPRTEQRNKLVQQAWQPDMIWAGHIGNHLGMLAYAWNKRHVAPWLMPTATEQPTSAPATIEVDE